MADLVCWKCGASLADLTLPLRRLEECRKCGAELHVCKLCEWYSIGVAKHCREPIAEEVKDKERANFCDYFKPRPGAYAHGRRRSVEQGANRAGCAVRRRRSAASAPSAADRHAPSWTACSRNSGSLATKSALVSRRGRVCVG